jgi:signal peptidase
VNTTHAKAVRGVPLKRILGWVEAALVVLVLVFWFFELRPQRFGGPAGYALVNGRSMLPEYHTGDVVIVHRHSRYRVGDVIAYTVPKGFAGSGSQVIHRIIGGDAKTGFTVQGDNRTAPDIWRPKPSDVVGAQWAHIPRFGVVVRLLHTPVFLAGLAALIAVLSVVFHKPKQKQETEPAPIGEAAAQPALQEDAPAAHGRQMLAIEGSVPAGSTVCSHGCHILLPGARFDPHEGTPVEHAAAAAGDRPIVSAEALVRPEPSYDPVWWRQPRGPAERLAEYELAPAYRIVDAIDFERLEREIHEAVRTAADVRETVGRLVGAIGEYGEHLRSHTEVLKNLAAATAELRGTTVELREFLASLTALLTRMSEQPGGSTST